MEHLSCLHCCGQKRSRPFFVISQEDFLTSHNLCLDCNLGGESIMPMPTHVNGRPVKTGAWTNEEDQLLAVWQKEYGNRWSAVSKKIPGRTGQQCAQRWRHKVNPNIRKEKWTEAEDSLLADLYQRHGSAWAEISRHLKGRTDQQCMGRWRRHLDPAIKREAWKPREDEELTELHVKYGSQWATIAKYLPGRTAQQCRARWHQMEPDYGETPQQNMRGSVTCRTASKPKRSKAKKHSAYSESDDEELEISDCSFEGEEDCSEDDLEYQSQRIQHHPERLRSGVSFPQGADGSASQESDWTTSAYMHTGRRNRQKNGWHMQEPQDGLRDSPSNYYSSAVDEDPGVEEAQDTESPPFLSSEAYQNGPTADTHFLNEMTYVRRSPSCRVPSPEDHQSEKSFHTKPLTPARLRAVQEMHKTPHKQHSPGVSEQTAWESSPIDILRLFKSPETRTNMNFLRSPSLHGITTPDWARRSGMTPPSTGKSKRQRNVDENTQCVETPSKRGPVARRLDVESALRPSASERLRQRQNARDGEHQSQFTPDFLCSPAKKLRSSIKRRDVEAQLASMTEKENFACDALQQLSMAATLIDKMSNTEPSKYI